MLTPVVNTSTTIQIKHYEICIQQSTSDTCDRTLIIAPTEDFNFTIQNLTANTLYIIMVFAITINDERGPPSDVVTFETFPLGRVYNYKPYHNSIHIFILTSANRRNNQPRCCNQRFI